MLLQDTKYTDVNVRQELRNTCTCDVKPDGRVCVLHGDNPDHVGDGVALHDAEGKRALVEGQWSGAQLRLRDPLDVQAASGCLLGSTVIHCLDLKTWGSGVSV